jgi:hypothetical protein
MEFQSPENSSARWFYFYGYIMPPLYKKHKIDEDGLCMYRSIQSAVAGGNMDDNEAFENINELKKAIHAYICTHKTEFYHFFLLPSRSSSRSPSPLPVQKKKTAAGAVKAAKAKSKKSGIVYADLNIDNISFSRYCSNRNIMMSDDHWGGNVELVAASNLLGLRIVIHSPKRPYERIPGNVIVPFAGVYGMTIHLTHDGQHYEWLEPRVPPGARASPQRASPRSVSPVNLVSRSPMASSYKNELSRLHKKSGSVKAFQTAMAGGVYGNNANMAGAYLITRGFPALAQSSQARGYAHVLFRAETAAAKGKRSPAKRKRSASGP